MGMESLGGSQIGKSDRGKCEPFYLFESVLSDILSTDQGQLGDQTDRVEGVEETECRPGGAGEKFSRRREAPDHVA